MKCISMFLIALTCLCRSNIYLASNRSSMECPSSQSALPTHSQGSTLNPQSSIHHVKTKDSWWLLPARILQGKAVCQRLAIWKENPTKLLRVNFLVPKTTACYSTISCFILDRYITGHYRWRVLHVFGVFSQKTAVFQLCALTHQNVEFGVWENQGVKASQVHVLCIFKVLLQH